MAILLFRYIRGKVREKKAAKAATADESHLVPEIAPRQEATPHASDSRIDGQANAIPPQSPEATTKASAVNATENARIAAEASQRRKRRWKLILGLILPNFLAAVDVTIVAPAIPIISSHFNHLSGSFNWIVAAYTLTFTTFVPVSGQIADIYGRHAALQFQMFWILIGSVFCASAVTWGMLLFGRALQGLGAAGVMNLTRIVLSDNVSLADNSKNNTVFSLIAGISYAVGPVIGGYLANSSWRYCFVLPIPIAVLAHFLIFFLMRKELVKGRVSAKSGDSRRTGYISGLATIDWPGMVFFIFGIGLIILAIQWGGTQYKWSSAAVVAPLVIGSVLIITFFVHEYLLGPDRFTTRFFPRQVAMIPSTLFRKKDMSLILIINFATGVSLVSAFYFISIYWQLAEGYSASQAGVQLLYYTPGLGVGVYSAMFLCNVWPAQTFYPLMAGSIIEGVGLSLLTWAVSTRQRALVNGMLALAGAGTGLRFMPVVLHSAGIWPTRIAASQTLLSFMIPLGETIGISMMSAVFSNKYNTYLRSINTGTSDTSFQGNAPPNLSTLDSLPPALKQSVQNAASRAVMWSFVSILPFMGLSIVAACFLGNVWIGKDAKKGKDGQVARQEVKGQVIYGSFIGAALSGGVQRNKQVVEPFDPTAEWTEKAPHVEDTPKQTDRVWV
ncbi:MFS general substrate transporter [Melanomma pulvis-pyrius CBS 109.77]|uniref:MFS general substrate transporter n=1 Tax=Melanomma pulvis-pyrius CBS 109.77 TaxID=1314802 RepID=A0A6A6XQL5_9PLEO|nr:MFS general substrate transporter [Melanomma pulvis-pyrius CBS 109.77]